MGWDGGKGSGPPGKSQVAIGFLSTDGPLREAIGPLESNCFSKEVRTALMKNKQTNNNVVKTSSDEFFSWYCSYVENKRT